MKQPSDADLRAIAALADGPRPTGAIDAAAAKRLLASGMIVTERIRNTVAGRRHDVEGYRLTGAGRAVARLLVSQPLKSGVDSGAGNEA